MRLEEAGYAGKLLKVLRDRGIEVYDRIRVVKNGFLYEGVLMPKPELSHPSCIILKLDNGYNVGISITSETKIELVAKGRPAKPELPPVPLKIREDLPEVVIIGTGGTIASRVDYKTGAVYPALTARDLYNIVPELSDIARLKMDVLFNIFSEDMTPKRWEAIARTVAKYVEEGVAGVVITHGTDTMGYTAAALSFALQDLPIPVVLVGAQRSSDRPSSDAALNLISAVKIAAQSPIAEVVVVMHGETGDTYCLVHRGTKVRKCHTSRRDAFRSINARPLAKVYKDRIVMLTSSYRRRDPNRQLKLEAKFDEKVQLIKTFPGIDPEIIDFLVDKGYHGIVLEGTGLGHAPEYILPSIKRAIEEGVAVVMTSQCLWGRINMNVYRRGVELLKMGVIPGEDMLPETALVKLMWVLAHTRDLKEVRRLMLTNIAGEINPRTEPLSYPPMEV
ncbi:MAG: Glu-tRNA(Gln) amidotransferase GatDE subunit D [Thermoprotei archaeon]|nr:MAG: Glu-tRNA(Gln) amidotransferase GatDE subunit D [Thermoprotei archaeon]